MERGVRTGDYSVKAKHGDIIVSRDVVSGGGNIAKAGSRPDIKAENTAKIFEGKKEKKRPRLILSDSESDEGLETYQNANYYVDRKPPIKIVTDVGTDQDINGSVGRKSIRIETVKRSQDVGVGRNIVKSSDFKHNEETGIDRREIKVEPSFRKREEGVIDRKRFKVEEGGIDMKMIKVEEGGIDRRRIKVDHFKYHERSVAGRKEINAKAGPCKQKEDTELGSSKMRVDHFNRREEIESDQKKLKVDPFKEAEINRKRINPVDPFKYREDAVKKIKVDPTKCREEIDVDRKMIKVVPVRGKEESEAKGTLVKDVKLITYVRQREGKNGSSSHNLTDIQSQQPIMGRKNNTNTVLGRQKGQDHPDDEGFRMQKAEHPHLDGVAREKLRLSLNHSIRLQGKGGVLKLTPNHKKPAVGLPEVSHNHRKPEGMARNDRSEANSPMQKKVFHQPPLGFDPQKSDSYSMVPKKNQQGRSLYFLTDKTPDQKRKGTDISMRNISPNIEKVSRGKTSSQPESSAVHIDLVPLSSKKMKTKLGDIEPFPGKNMETTLVDRVHLSRKIMATKHADVAPSSSKQMGAEHFDVVPSSAKMLETKHTDMEPLSRKNTETKHVDTVPLLGKKAETKMGEAHRLRQQRLLLRQRLRKLILNAGWKIEMRPRRGRNYQDSVYVSPEGVGYWSIVNAYNALLRESNCKDEEKGHLGLEKPGGQEMDIPIEDLSILTRKTKAKELRKIKGGKMAKKIKEQAGGARSVKVRDGSQRKNLKGATKQHLIKKKHARANMKINSDFAKEGKALKGRIKENGGLGLNLKGINRNLSGNYHHKKSSHLSRGCALVVRGSSKGNPNPDDHSIPYSGKRNILSWLIDSGVVPENGKVHYMNKKFTRVMMEGWITRDGIHCGCCSKIVTVSKFEIHAGSKLRQPYQNVLLETGISLMQCQIKAWNAQDESKRIGFHVVDLNGSDKNDDTCGICGDGGDLICCDSCPSTFHLYCLDLQALPPGDWHCPYCSCRFCGVVEGTNLGEEATISPILSCLQCEEKYHCDCTGKMNAMTASTVGPHATFCGKDCQKLFKRLQDLLGLKNDLDGGFSWTLIRRFDEDSEVSRRGLAQRAECNSKIAVALTVMDECFMPIIDQRSRVNTIHNVVYNSGSNFNRLNYGGFYTVLLERGDDIISAASIRIHGTRLAEMPLIGTRHIYRRQGMCRRLFNAIESVLCSLKVEKLVIPAISDLMQTWIEVFGFKPLEEWHKHEIRSMNMVVFPGTDMLQKQLKKSDFTGGKYTQPGEGENHVGTELKCSQHNASKMANQSVVASAPGSYVHECSEVNLCHGFGVIGPKEAPIVGSEHPSGEHIVDSNGSEALSSIPCEDLEIMCTADVNELKSSQHDTSEVENKSLPSSSAEPNPLEFVEDALHNTFVVEVEGAAMEPNFPSFGEGYIHHTSDVNTNTLEVSSSSKSQPSTRETKYGIFEPVNKSSEVSTEALEVDFGPNDQSSAMDTVPFTSDLIVESPEAALDMGCRLASDVVNACGVSEVIGSKYAAHLKSNCAAGEYIVNGDGIVRLLAIPYGASDIMCTDTVNGLKYIQHDTTELANVSLTASLVEPSPHPSGMVIIHDAREEKFEDAAVGSDLHAFGENFVGHNSEFCTKSVEVAWRSTFQSSSEDTVCYTAESLEGAKKSHVASVVVTNIHASGEATDNDIYELSMDSL